jgi:hypothetical protein
MGDWFGLEFQSSLAGLGKDLLDAAYPGLGSAKSSRTVLGYFQAPLRGWDVLKRAPTTAWMAQAQSYDTDSPATQEQRIFATPPRHCARRRFASQA